MKRTVKRIYQLVVASLIIGILGTAHAGWVPAPDVGPSIPHEMMLVLAWALVVGAAIGLASASCWAIWWTVYHTVKRLSR
jgi:hypothetical protein